MSHIFPPLPISLHRLAIEETCLICGVRSWRYKDGSRWVEREGCVKAVKSIQTTQKTENQLKSIDIPLDDLESAAVIAKLCENADVKFKIITPKKLLHIRVWYNEPIDLFWLGCNYVAKSTGLFKGALTI